jgi:ribose transport system permease protein
LGVWCIGAVWLHSIPFRESLHRGLQVLLVPFYVAYYAAVRYRECKRPALLYMLGLVSVLAGWLLPDVPLPPWAEVTLVVFWMLEICAAIGLLHGVLITRVGLQPFVVTLCGLLFYRGVARWLTDDQTQGFGTGYEGLKSLVTARPCSLASLVAMAGLCLAGWGLYRWIGRRENDEDDDPSVSPWCLTLVGLTLSLTSVLSWLPGLPEAAPDVPTWTQRSMFWIGLLGSVGGVVGLSLRALLRRSWGVLWGDALALTGLLLLWWFAALGYVSSGDPDLAWWKIMLVGLALIALMFGVARFLTANWKSGLRQRSATFLTASAQAFLLLGMIPLDRVQAPAPLLVMLVIAILAGFFLNQTLYGRYLLALGRNEEAARYSGINTAAMTVLAYVLCTLLAGVAAVLFSLDVNGIQPAGHGNFYELYAISAAVLGGCSLRGGEGSVLGVVIGTAVMRVLYNAITMLGIPDKLEFAIIGAVLLAGVMADELLRRAAQQRERRTQS